MVSSPTVLVGASESSSVPAPTKSSIVPLLIAVALGVLIGTSSVGVAGYYLMRSGKLSLQRGAISKSEPIIPVMGRALVLEPLLVNLADPGGGSYLRVALTLRVADVPGKKDVEPNKEKAKDSDAVVAAVRDTVLAVLGRQTAEELLAPGGKEKLKAELKSSMAMHNSDLKVIDVFFTDFLVQR
jgi:flagellar FliL protein